MRDVILAAAGAAVDATPLASTERPVASTQDMETREAAARSSGESEGFKKGSASERARIKAILGSEHAKGREDLAAYFAFETEMPPETVVAALAKSPSVRGTLDNAMTREVQPRLGAGGDRMEVLPRVISTEEVYARRRAAVAAVAKR